MKILLILLAVLATPFTSQAFEKFAPICYGAENVSQKEPFLLTIMNVTHDEEIAVTEFLMNDDVLVISRTMHFDHATTFVLSVNESNLPQDINANEFISEKLVTLFLDLDLADHNWALECNKRMVPTPRGGGAN